MKSGAPLLGMAKSITSLKYIFIDVFIFSLVEI